VRRNSYPEGKEKRMLYRMLVPLTLVAAVAVGGGSELWAGKKDKGAKKPKPEVVTRPIVKVVDLVIDDIIFDEGQLIANAVATLDIAGRVITQEIEIPLELAGSPGAEVECDILNLALGPVHLDVLGLNVDLDDCEGGPVTVDIVGVEGDLLGDLLCDIAGALNAGIDLGDILGGLTDEELAAFTGALSEILDNLLGQLLDAGTPVASPQLAASDHRCDILTLEIPEGLHVNLLGLQVDTSGICLDVYALEGNGNLLGNLLCSLTNLLDNPGKNAGGQKALVKNINKVLDRLGL
jgi:hypothetical protein